MPAMASSRLDRYLPGLATLKSYDRSWLRGDLVAGVVLTALLIPAGMGYAEVAGLPPVTGLYATIIPLIAYAIVGPSRILVLGPDSSLAPIIAAAIIPLAAFDAERVALAGVLAIEVGIVLVIGGLLRVGFVTDLLSKPIRIGYLNGIALVVLLSQLPKLLGFSIEGDSALEEAVDFVTGIADGEVDGLSTAIGVSCLGVILLLKLWRRAFPGVLIAVIGAIVVVAVFVSGWQFTISCTSKPSSSTTVTCPSRSLRTPKAVTDPGSTPSSAIIASALAKDSRPCAPISRCSDFRFTARLSSATTRKWRPFLSFTKRFFVWPPAISPRRFCDSATVNRAGCSMVVASIARSARYVISSSRVAGTACPVVLACK